MTPLAIFWILYLIYLALKKPEPRETMEQFLESISEVYPIIKPVYGVRKERVQDSREERTW